MPRKEVINIEMILNTAFEMTRAEGYENVTARKIASTAGCSTQPIFRIYKNMDELWDDVYKKAVSFYKDFYFIYPKTSKIPFANLGLAYIAFAREESNLFKLLFLSNDIKKNSMYEIINGSNGNVVNEIKIAKENGCKNPEEMFMKMWIFIHGAACMTLTGDYDLSNDETFQLIEQSYNSFNK